MSGLRRRSLAMLLVALVAVLANVVSRSFCTATSSATHAAEASLGINTVFCGVAGLTIAPDFAPTGPQGQAPHHCNMCMASAPAVVAEVLRIADAVIYPAVTRGQRPPSRSKPPTSRHSPQIVGIRGPPSAV